MKLRALDMSQEVDRTRSGGRLSTEAGPRKVKARMFLLEPFKHQLLVDLLLGEHVQLPVTLL